MRILFAGEAAKGHLYPIIAVYEELKTKLSEKKVEAMLISDNMEFVEELFEGAVMPFKIINAPESHKFDFMDVLRFPKGFFQAMKYVYDYMPDLIFAKGGYVSLPVVMYGWLFKIPVIIHESDIDPTSLDKFMYHFANKVALSFEDTKKYYNLHKAILTGNPIRASITKGNKEKALQEFEMHEKKPIIFIMAGSEGAGMMNNVVMEILPALLEKYQIIHQCGFRGYKHVKEAVQKMNISNLSDYHLFPFFKEKAADAYAACDIVISRAGANTVSEIMAVGKPSILISVSSNVTDKQNKNAYYYSEAGAAILLNEKNLKPHMILNSIKEIFHDSLKVMEMRRVAKSISQPDAAKKVVEEILKIAD